MGRGIRIDILAIGSLRQGDALIHLLICICRLFRVVWILIRYN